MAHTNYVPAFGLHWLTPFYDSFAGPFADSLRKWLLQQADIHPGQRVLDLGCGTGLLTMMVKRSVPEAQVTGLDSDENILAIAKRKAESAQLSIQWEHALATGMPFPDRMFDVTVSSFVTHHLISVEKVSAFKEVHRILLPGGCFHILDFGPPSNLLTRVQAAVVKHLERTADNFEGRITPMLMEAGFRSAEEMGRAVTFLGPVSFYRGSKGT